MPARQPAAVANAGPDLLLDFGGTSLLDRGVVRPERPGRPRLQVAVGQHHLRHGGHAHSQGIAILAADAGRLRR